MKMKNKTITTNKGIQILACEKMGSHPLLPSMNETAVAIKKIEKKTNHKQRF